MTKYRGAPAPAAERTASDGRVDWFFGTGAVRAERQLVWLTVALGLAAVWLGAAADAAVTWAWWQYVLVTVVVIDVVGGVVANALGSAKQLFHGDPPAGMGAVGRLVRNDVAFAAAHVHPLLLWASFDGAGRGWGLSWYAATTLSVVAVVAAPLYLKRPVAFAAVTVGAILATVVEAPPGLAWFPVVLQLKLVLAHAVPEQPHRPR